MTAIAENRRLVKPHIQSSAILPGTGIHRVGEMQVIKGEIRSLGKLKAIGYKNRRVSRFRKVTDRPVVIKTTEEFFERNNRLRLEERLNRRYKSLIHIYFWGGVFRCMFKTLSTIFLTSPDLPTIRFQYVSQ